MEYQIHRYKTTSAHNLQRSKQLRLAHFYLEKLRYIHNLYRRGGDHILYAVRLLEQDWAQIRQRHTWASEHSVHNRDAAILCSAFPWAAGKLLDLMLTLEEQARWQELARSVAHQHNDPHAELFHLLALAQIHEKLDSYLQAKAYVEQALALANQIDDQVRKPCPSCRKLATIGALRR